MCLSKEGFDKVFSAYKTKIFEDQIQFLGNYSFFRDLSKFTLLELLYHLRTETFTSQSTIYSEKDSSEFIYLIKSGEIELSKKYMFRESRPAESMIITESQKQNQYKLTKENKNLIVQKVFEEDEGFIDSRSSL